MIRYVVLVLAMLTSMALPAIAEQPLPSGWNFSTVDDPLGDTVLTGINNLGGVTGYVTPEYGGAEAVITQCSSGCAGWFSINYPGYASVATGLSNTQIESGYYYGANGFVAYYRDRGVYTSYGKNNTKFLGVNNILCGGVDCIKHHIKPNPHTDPLLVGYTLSGLQISGNTAFMYDAKTKAVTAFTPPGSVGVGAAGINGKGEACGWMTNKAGTIMSWFYSHGQYFEFSYPGATATYARAVNWEEQIVGEFIDGSGAVHGFAMAFPELPKPTFVLLDYPGATRTVARSINNHDDIVGTYTDTAGKVHGFLAVPTT